MGINLIPRWYLAPLVVALAGCTVENPLFLDAAVPPDVRSHKDVKVRQDGQNRDKRPATDRKVVPDRGRDKAQPKDHGLPPDLQVKDQSRPDQQLPPDLVPSPDAKPCPPSTACTSYWMGPNGCKSKHALAGNPCDDKDACTLGDVCDGKGGCKGLPFGCKAGTSHTKACGNCGSQTRTCSSKCIWSTYSACSGQGPCGPNTKQTKVCDSCGVQTRTCSSKCTWGGWGTCTNKGICAPKQVQTQKCGNCGSQTRTCSSTCTWTGWSACTSQGACFPNSKQSLACGTCGTKWRTCQSNCTWGSYGSCSSTGTCTPNTKQSLACGKCGTKWRTCKSNCTWGSYGACGSQGICAPFTSASCTGTDACGATANGSTTCSSACKWGSCVVPTPSKCTRTVYATADAYISKHHPNTNYGMTTSLLSNSSASRETRVYAKFSLPAAISGKTITLAQLGFRWAGDWVCGRSALLVSGSLVGAAWQETSITWNNRPKDGTCSGVTLAQQAGNKQMNSYGQWWCTFNATARVKCWAAGTANHGIVVGQYAVGGYGAPRAQWYTKGTSSSKPYLYIEYTP